LPGTEVAYALAALASAIAAVLAWGARLWWGREYGAAKDEIIRAKEAQITALERELQGLRELTPMRIREYFLSVKEQLEEYNAVLQEQLKSAKREIGQKEAAIGALRDQGSEQGAQIAALEHERDAIKQATALLEKQLVELRAKYESQDVLVWHNAQAFQNIQNAAESLQNLTTKFYFDPKWFDLSKQLQHNYLVFSNYFFKENVQQPSQDANDPSQGKQDPGKQGEE
jgi:DNA repair exonuclease SbcCD ATPase subunit